MGDMIVEIIITKSKKPWPEKSAGRMLAFEQLG